MAILCLVLAAAAIAVDQILKQLVLTHLVPVGTVTVLPGLLDFTYVENRGAAFGILQNQRWFFVVVTMVLCACIIYLLFRYKQHEFFSYGASALIIGGGLGNLIDRFHYGFVVDYIHVSFFPPVFNFADCCVTVGTVFLMIHVLFFSDSAQKEKKAV